MQALYGRVNEALLNSIIYTYLTQTQIEGSHSIEAPTICMCS